MDRLLGAACALFFVLFIVNLDFNRKPKGADRLEVFDDEITARLRGQDGGLDDL